MGISANFADDNLLNELVFLAQLITFEVDLALQSLLLTPHTLQILLDVLNRNVIVALQGFLFGYAPEFVNFGLCSKGLGLATPFFDL